jgi:NADH-quinone oxidoreductase subunit G
LVEPSDSEPRVPELPPARPAEGELQLVAIAHLFGTEELSSYSPAVVELAPARYVALHPDDAAKAGLGEGDAARVEGIAGPLTVQLRARLARGVAGIPAGLPGLEGVSLPRWGKVVKP